MSRQFGPEHSLLKPDLQLLHQAADTPSAARPEVRQKSSPSLLHSEGMDQISHTQKTGQSRLARKARPAVAVTITQLLSNHAKFILVPCHDLYLA
jgi:hypothetical protein